MKTPMPKHLLGIFGRELYAEIVRLSENGADYSEIVELLSRKRVLSETDKRNIYNLCKSWGV